MQDKIDAEKEKLKGTALQWIERKISGVSSWILVPLLVFLNVMESASDIVNALSIPSIPVPVANLIAVLTFLDTFVAWGYNEAVTGTLIAAITFELLRRANACFSAWTGGNEKGPTS